MRSLDEIIAALPPQQRAQVLARGRVLISAETKRIIAEVMKRRRGALERLAKR